MPPEPPVNPPGGLEKSERGKSKGELLSQALRKHLPLSWQGDPFCVDTCFCFSQTLKTWVGLTSLKVKPFSNLKMSSRGRRSALIFEEKEESTTV